MINETQPNFEDIPANPSRKDFGYLPADKNLSPLVTIITPYYNTGEVFYETARCIFTQSFQQWEWIIVNDGSDVPSAKLILSEFRDRDPRIRVINHSENRGLSAARNTGFANANCEYVLLIDSDDLLEPTAVEKWYWYLITHPQYGFVASYHVAFGGMNYLWMGGFHDGEMNIQRNRVSMICMIHKSVHEAVGGFDETIRGGLEDWDFWLRCAARGFWGATVPEYLAWYRVRGDHSDRWENLNEDRIDKFRQIFRGKYPGLYSGEFPKPLETVDLDLTEININLLNSNKLIKTKSHLLIILPWMVMGGAERFMLNLLSQLIERGWNITIVTTAPSDNAWRHEFEKHTTDIFILPNFLPLKDFPRFIGSIIQSRGIDAVLIQGSHEGYRLSPIIRALHPDILIADFLHFVTPDWMDGGFPKLSLLYRDCFDITLTSCNQVRDWMVKRGANPNQIQTCYIGVNPDQWKPDSQLRESIRKELNISSYETVILFAGRLEEQKQPDVFVDTLGLLVEKSLPCKGLIAGDGSLKDSLEQRLKARGLQEIVHMLGSQPTERMPAVMAASDILFLPSKNEGISQAIYEAMSCGVVVLGAMVGGQIELVTKECGVLIPEIDKNHQPVAYAKILDELISNSTLYQEMRINGRNRILSQFSVDRMGEQIENIFMINKKVSGTKNTNQFIFSKNQLLRESRVIIEYLQARQEWLKLTKMYGEMDREHKKLFEKYQDLLQQLYQPKPASYWFYLWIRQLFLPVYKWFGYKKILGPFVEIKAAIKKHMLK